LRKEVKQITFIPFALFFIFSILFFGFFYYFLNDFFNQDIKNIEKRVINLEKRHLNRDIKNFKKSYYLIFDTIYSTTNSNLSIFLKSILEKYRFKDIYLSADNTFIIGKIPNKKFKYEIYQNRYIILNYKNQKFLVYLVNRGKNIYLAGINIKYLNLLALNKLRKYLDEINKNSSSYIAIGKITTFNPDKNGVFGYVFYMPPKFREKEGNELTINKPDVKGNYFRKKYFECLKNNKSCFVKYYFKNPKTEKIEEKISYFTIIDNKYSVMKGIYSSQIRDEIKKEIKLEQNKLKKIFFYSLIIYFILLSIILAFLYIFIKKFKQSIISQYESLLADIKFNYYYDKLTLLPNRNKLIEDLDKFRSLILIDIDDFSDINDVYGFEIGNEILQYLAKEFSKEFNNVYRAGSDEFVILFKREIDKNDLCNIAKRDFKFNLIKLSFTVAGSNEKGKLLKTAESALKIAKSKKENCIIFNRDIEKLHFERIKTIQKLKEVLEKERIIPFYQCIKGKDEKYEALMRIEMDGKFLSPFVFMDLLKEAKLYSKFSQIMIKKVFDDKISNVSINLSFNDIVNEETRELIKNLIKNCKKNENITFEILESESISNFDMVKNFIKEVKKEKIKISIDDFGSGYSNFIRILELNPDFIKIDGSLVKNIEDEKYFEIIKLIVEFAKKFSIYTVAEFVENEKIYNKLKDLNIDYYQGYYFCKPLPIEKIFK